jgi:mannose-1-phosphate guanylyltransferase
LCRATAENLNDRSKTNCEDDFQLFSSGLPMLHGVVMAGGSGTRFWPLSRHARPKQFLKLNGERTLLQQTFDRCQGLIDPRRTWVVTNHSQAGETRRQAPELPAEQVLVEPCGRNTAPCIGLAAIHLLREDPDAVMAVMPADHVIQPAEQFRQGLQQGAELVRQDPERLVLFGVRPTYPATGFGYIELGERDESGVVPVASFREKPDVSTAEQYLQQGRYLWNCGIFLWRADTILQELQRHEPELHAGLMRLREALDTPLREAAIADEFPKLKSISIDYAVLERARNVCVIEAPFEWDDVGSWEAMARLNGVDGAGNTLSGPHCAVDNRGCIVHSSDDHLIATIDVEDLLIVHTPDATLVARRGDEQSLRRLIDELKARGLDRYL